MRKYGFTHNDIKPDNLVLTNKNDNLEKKFIKFIDLGVANSSLKV